MKRAGRGDLAEAMDVPAPDAGPVPLPGVSSVSWKIHREVLLLLGWGRALLLQISHPLVARGVADHSAFLAHRHGRLGRLRQTLDAMLTLTFGTAEEARRVASGINAIHDRIYGQLPKTAGVFPGGATYSAHDPTLLRWVHATLLDSFMLTYELYVGPLTPEEKDRYCAESSAIEPLLGIPNGYLPRSVEELQKYMDKMLASGEITVTETARALARKIVSPPIPRPLVWFLRLPTVGLLPPAIRDAYGFPWDSRREAALRRSAGLVRALVSLAPSMLRHWPVARAAFRRSASRPL